MKKTLAICVLALMAAGLASARRVAITKRVNASQLHAELAAAGFQVKSVGYDDRTSRGWVELADSKKKDLTTIIKAHKYVSHEQLIQEREKIRGQVLGSIRNLQSKVEKGEATPAERDQLLVDLARLVRLMAGDQI